MWEMNDNFRATPYESSQGFFGLTRAMGVIAELRHYERKKSCTARTLGPYTRRL
jgi:hypothetical protein